MIITFSANNGWIVINYNFSLKGYILPHLFVYLFRVFICSVVGVCLSADSFVFSTNSKILMHGIKLAHAFDRLAAIKHPPDCLVPQGPL